MSEHASGKLSGRFHVLLIVHERQRLQREEAEELQEECASIEMAMEQLYQLDQVAYVRFASVYKNFREAKDFEEFVEGLHDQ